MEANVTNEGAASEALLRTRRLISGIAGGFLGRGLGLIAPLVVMPAMLHYLGDDQFGAWMTAVSITSMAMFTDLGIGNGLLTRLASASGRNARDEMRADISSAYLCLSIVAVLAAAVFAIGLAGLQSGILSNGHPPLTPGALSIAAACIGAFIVGVPTSVIQRVMYAAQEVWISNLWQVAAALISVALCLGAIHLRLAGWTVVLCYSLPPSATMIVSAIWYFRRNPHLKPAFRDASVDSARELLALGARFLVLSVLTATAMNVDNVIIAAKAGADAVTTYAVPARLGSLMGLMITTLYLPLWAANGEALSRGDYKWVRQSSKRMSVLGAMVVAGVGIVLVAGGNHLIHAWMGRSFDGQRRILALIALLSVSMALTSPYQMILNSLGKTKPQIAAWVGFLATTAVAKIAFVGPQSLWAAPLISSLGYSLIILPSMYRSALRLTRGLPT